MAERIDTECTDMLDLFEACLDDGARPALFYFDQSLSYAEVDALSDALARYLLDRGIGRGDRIAILMQNVPQFLLALVASWKLGAIPVPCNPMYRSAELGRIFEDCEPSAVIGLDSCIDAARAALRMATVDAILLATSPLSFQSRNDSRMDAAPAAVDPDVVTLETVLAATYGPPPSIDLDGADIGLILYTSGTTGLPKGAMIRHRNLAFNAAALRDFCALRRESRILALAPFFHVTGLSCQIGAAFSACAALVLHYRVEPSLLLDTIREHRPTFVIGAITAFNALANVPGVGPEDMASFDRVYSGGAPIPPALLAALGARLGVKIHSCYGMTETTAQTHMAPFGADIPVDIASGALSIGKAMPFTEATIVGDDGNVMPVGEAGELLVRGPQIMAGYWRKPEETAAALGDGWMHTGDVAFVDGQGWYYLVDRIKDVIIASGFKVWPREVEDVLYAHAAVREAAVVGEADSYRGETVIAYVSLKPGAAVAPASLIDHCRAQLAAYKAPRRIEIVDELPKTLTGKIQRMALRTPSAAR